MGKTLLPLILILIIAFCLSPINGILIPQNPSPTHMEWWQESIIYQIYPRSHQDSDGDGVGDLSDVNHYSFNLTVTAGITKGIESRLDHFVDIGVGAVWISPIYKSPMKDFGYDISNFTDIDPTFGTMADFQSLSSALKERGIKLIMDFVPNHSSDEHEWFKKSVQKVEPYTDYYVWMDPKGYDEDENPIVPNNWVSVFGGSMWEWNEQREQFYLHHYVKEQPELNFENPKVLEEMLATMKFWLDMGVDGFRMDAVPHLYEDQRFLDEKEDPNRPAEALPDEYRYWLHEYTYNLPQVLDTLAEFRKLLDIYSLADGRPRAMTVEATIPYLEGVMEYYGNNTRPIAHFPCNFEFIKKLTSEFNGSSIMNIVDEWLTKMPEGKTANWNVGNHDNARVSSRFGTKTVDAFNMIIHLLPGASIAYYGEEIGMENAFISWEDTVDPFGCNAGPDRYEIFSRDPERTPMQWSNETNAGFSTAERTWLPVHENYVGLNVQAQNSAEESHLQIFKRISQLRKTDIWRYGSVETNATNSGQIFGLARIYNDNGFLVLVNFGDTEVTVDATSYYMGVPEIATVFVKSINFTPENIVIGAIINTKSVTIGPDHSLVLEF